MWAHDFSREVNSYAGNHLTLLLVAVQLSLQSILNDLAISFCITNALATSRAPGAGILSNLMTEKYLVCGIRRLDNTLSAV